MAEQKKNRTRSKQVMCRLNDDEFSKYQVLLEKSGLSAQDFMRKNITTTRFTVVNKVSKDHENEEMGNALFQLSKVGTNINQIAKQLNTFGVVLPDSFKVEYVELLRELKKTTIAIREVVEKNDSETRIK